MFLWPNNHCNNLNTAKIRCACAIRSTTRQFVHLRKSPNHTRRCITENGGRPTEPLAFCDCCSQPGRGAVAVFPIICGKRDWISTVSTPKRSPLHQDSIEVRISIAFQRVYELFGFNGFLVINSLHRTVFGELCACAVFLREQWFLMVKLFKM